MIDDRCPPLHDGPVQEVDCHGLHTLTAAGWLLLAHYEIETLEQPPDYTDDGQRLLTPPAERLRSRRFLLGLREKTALGDAVSRRRGAERDAQEAEGRADQAARELADQKAALDEAVRQSKMDCERRKSLQEQLDACRASRDALEKGLAALRSAFGDIAVREALEAAPGGMKAPLGKAGGKHG